MATAVGAIIALLSGFNVIHWDTSQTALVVAASASGVMFVGSLVAHLRKNTPSEWASVGMSLIAFAGSGLAALNAINVLDLTADQVELVIGVLVAVLGLAGIPVINAKTSAEVASVTQQLTALPGGANDPAAGSV